MRVIMRLIGYAIYALLILSVAGIAVIFTGLTSPFIVAGVTLMVVGLICLANMLVHWGE